MLQKYNHVCRIAEVEKCDYHWVQMPWQQSKRKHWACLEHFIKLPVSNNYYIAATIRMGFGRL